LGGVIGEKGSKRRKNLPFIFSDVCKYKLGIRRKKKRELKIFGLR